MSRKLAFMIQWGGERYHPGPVNLLGPLVLLAVGVLAGVLLVPALEHLVPRARRRLGGCPLARVGVAQSGSGGVSS